MDHLAVCEGPREQTPVFSRMLTPLAQPKKQVHTYTANLRVAGLSPALPSRIARDEPSLSRHPNYYGMEPPRPADVRSAPLPSPARRTSQNLSPRVRYPLRAGGQHPVRASGNHHYITEAHQLDEAALLSGGIARGG